MGAWNVLSLREDVHLSLLSSELKRLNIGIAALSEVRRPDSDEIIVGGYTYCWSGHSDCYHAQEVDVAVSKKLTPMKIEGTPDNWETKDSSLIRCRFPGLWTCSD